MESDIENLPNLGPRSRQMLGEIDIRTIDELRALGAVEAYARLRFRFGKQVGRNMLHAIHAALENRDWRDVTVAEKRRLDMLVAERATTK